MPGDPSAFASPPHPPPAPAPGQQDRLSAKAARGGGWFAESIQYQRNLPKRGPPGWVLFGGTAAIMAYGWYNLGSANRERRELRREKAWNRIALVPLLQAEQDRDTVRRIHANTLREQEIMRNVPGWVAGDLKAPVPGLGKFGDTSDPAASEPVYYTKRPVTPTYMFLPPEEQLLKELPWGKTVKIGD